MEWTIIFTDAYEAWFDHLLEKEKIAIATDLQVLAQMGPSLGRPYVDQVKGSRFSNMYEGIANQSLRPCLQEPFCLRHPSPGRDPQWWRQKREGSSKILQTVSR